MSCRNSKTIYALLVSALHFIILLSARSASACPDIDGIIDYNCDGRLRVVFTGDSIVSGTGDDDVEGGYPTRLRRLLENAEVISLGFPGIQTSFLRRMYEEDFAKRGLLSRRTENADIIILDVGRNDFHAGTGPESTAAELQRLTALLQSERGRGLNGAFIAVSALLPSTRAEQGAWLRRLNSILLQRSSKRFPVLVRFDQLPTRFLSGDGLHPDAGGYAKSARIAQRALTKKLRKKMGRTRRDNDRDGVFDAFERSEFGTDPALPDSDGDGYSDGAELFELLSDPMDGLSPGSPTPSASKSHQH